MTLTSELSVLDWNFSSDLVQDYWNQLEVQLIAVVDKIAPLTRVVINTVQTTTPSFIKHKLIIVTKFITSNLKLRKD